MLIQNVITDVYMVNAIQYQDNLPYRGQFTFNHEAEGLDFGQVSCDEVELCLDCFQFSLVVCVSFTFIADY
jgi:hypothetical protein